MESYLVARDTKEAWIYYLKGWYHAVEDRAPKPCYDYMVNQTAEREELYQKVSPPGDHIPINVDPFPVLDEGPEDPELRDVVELLRNGRAGERRR